MNQIIFSEGDTSSFETSVKQAMEAPMVHFEKELSALRTGRASTILVSDLKVESYGQMMKLKELATVSAPESRLLVIQPWDKGVIGNIEKAILASDLGVSPANDGQIIRLQFPMLSTERREELVKVLGKKTEECRVGIRNIRKEFHNQLRDAEKKKLVSEDFAKRLTDLLQKITDNFVAKADGMQEKKAADLKAV
jgi:ribosome recycling factor